MRFKRRSHYRKRKGPGTFYIGINWSQSSFGCCGEEKSSSSWRQWNPTSSVVQLADWFLQWLNDPGCKCRKQSRMHFKDEAVRGWRIRVERTQEREANGDRTGIKRQNGIMADERHVIKEIKGSNGVQKIWNAADNVGWRQGRWMSNWIRLCGTDKNFGLHQIFEKTLLNYPALKTVSRDIWTSLSLIESAITVMKIREGSSDTELRISFHRSVAVLVMVCVNWKQPRKLATGLCRKFQQTVFNGVSASLVSY